jgi:hypothetical protein
MAQQDGTQQPISSLAAYGVAQPLPKSADSAAASPAAPAAPVSSLSKFGTAQALPTPPAASDAGTSASTPEQPGVLARAGSALVNNTPLALIKPPETPTEQVIHAVSGDPGLASYRAAKGLVGSVENVVKAGPESYANAVKDYQRMHQEFINKDYRNAAASAGSLATDVAGVVDPTAAAGGQQARQLTEGTRPGADLTTPLVSQGANAALTLLGARAVGGEAAAEDTAVTSANRLIKNPFREGGFLRRQIALPAEAGDNVATAQSTTGVKAILGTKGTPTLSLGIDAETPYAVAKNLYQSVDKAAGTDLKVQYEKLANAQDRVMQTVDGSAEEAKALSDVKAQEDAIAQIKQRAKDANPNLDIDATLAQADKKFTEAQANKEFNFKFKDALKDDVRPGTEPLVDTDKAIAVAKKMTQPTIKYPTPRLYQTSIGEAGANKLLDVLYAAKKAGKTAVTLRYIRNATVGTAVLGAADAAVHDLTK